MRLALPWRRKPPLVVKDEPAPSVNRLIELCRQGSDLGNLVAAARAIDSRSALERALGNDRWFDNYVLNTWDEAHQVDVVRSYPWRIALPIADLCNARCTFCNSWLAGKQVLTLEQLERFMEVLPYAREVGIQGHGEPLANPNVGSILKRLGEVVDQRAKSYVITNGVFLRRRLQDLLDAHITYFNFSLNAATNQTHEVVMGLGESALDEVLAGIRELVALKAQYPKMGIGISMVLTTDNMHEAPDFVRLGNDLGVDQLYLRTLAPLEVSMPMPAILTPGLNYHRLAPVLRSDFRAIKERILEAVAVSRVPVNMQPETWDVDVVPAWARERLSKEPPPEISRSDALRSKSLREGMGPALPPTLGEFQLTAESTSDNPFGRAAPFDCSFLYQHFMATQLTTFRVVPCCYMTDVPGHAPLVFDGSRPFMDYWNCEAFVNLRRRLRDGPLMSNCLTCPWQGA